MLEKTKGRKKRHQRIRKKVIGTSERPRLVVYRSLKGIYMQLIDDTKQETIASCSSSDKDFLKEKIDGGKGKVGQAEKAGKFFAEKLKKKGIKKIAFDRGGYLYHGRVRALADSLRKAGLQF